MQPNPLLALSFATSDKCECNWNNAAFDAGIYRRSASSDAKKRQAGGRHSCRQMFSQASPVIAIAHQTNIVAAQNYVGGAWEDPRGNVHLESALG